MTTILLSTKLNIPPPPLNLVSRPHLVEILNTGLYSKLTLISAPAGYGKTTLISDWIHNPPSEIKNLQFSWLALDENDNDPTRFLAYLIAALQKIDPNIGQTAQALMQTPQPPSPEIFLTTLINDIAETEHPFFLILDDYHLIHTLSIHQYLIFLLDHIPPQMHLLIASREDPPLPLSQLRARGQIVEIHQEELRFSLKECTDFIQRVTGLDLSSTDIAALERRTEGWVAGLQLAAIAMQSPLSRHGRDDLENFVHSFTGSNRYILDYLIEEVFERQPVEVQEFLLKTSILEQLSAPLCDAVTKGSNSQDLLIKLEQANLFVVPLDLSRGWYRYHRLFTELLRHRLRISAAFSENQLHTQAYQWYEKNGLMNDAVHHAMAAEDWNEAARVIGLAAQQIIRNGQLATLHRWLAVLPENIVEENLELATTKGWTSFMMAELDNAKTYAELADSLLSADTRPDNQASLTILRASLALTQQDIPKTITLSQEGLDLMGKSDDYFLRGLALNNLAQAHMLVGDLPAATEIFREMIHLGPKVEQSPTTISAWANLAGLLHQGGRRREAVALCQQALNQCVDSRGRPLPLAGYAHIPMGILCYEVNDLECAHHHLERGIEYGKQLGVLTGVTTSSMIAIAQLQQAEGETDAALMTIEEIRQLASQFNLGYVNFLVSGVEADILMKQGNLAAAGHWAEAAGLSPVDTPNPLREGDYFTYTRFLLAQNRLTDAEALLTNFEGFAQRGGRYRSLITVCILQALVQQAQGNNNQALARLEMALHLAAPEGYRRAFLDEAHFLQGVQFLGGVQSFIDLLPKVRHLAPDFVDRLLEDTLSELDVQTPSLLVQLLVEPLSDRELEVLGLVADGLSNREIAEKLIISVGTVKTHVHNIYGKLEVRGRTQAIARARDLNLV